MSAPGQEESGAPPERGFRGALDDLLEGRWTACRKALKRCRRGFSDEAVHDLRVELRRLLSALGLVAAILPLSVVRPVENGVKRRLKIFSRLRDTQVQHRALGALEERFPAVRPFRRFLARRERRWVRRLSQGVAALRAGSLRRELRVVARELDGRLDTPERQEREAASVLAAVAAAHGRAQARYERIDPADTATIHALRVTYKRFRYMVEAIAHVVPGVSPSHLRRMHDYQGRMGRIQDVEVLLAQADRFAARREVEPAGWLAFRRELLRQRSRLVRRFVASGAQLRDFWPPPGGPAGRPGGGALPGRPAEPA